MRRLTVLVLMGVCCRVMAVCAGEAHASASAAHTYLMGCGGCHGLTGSSNSRLVPDLRDQVGYFLRTEQGREYLVRVPNVAMYTVSDRELTDMLNYMVFVLGGVSVSADARPYALGEVAALRRKPLNEVSLLAYRRRLVDELIASHDAPQRLRVYGSDTYADGR